MNLGLSTGFCFRQRIDLDLTCGYMPSAAYRLSKCACLSLRSSIYLRVKTQDVVV